MFDISHFYGSDLDVSPTGDLLVADATTTGEQRVYRRLLTNQALNSPTGEPLASADYTAHPNYGAGLPRYVGQPTRILEITSLIKKQIALETAVAASPAPVITVTPDANQLGVVVRYNDAQSKAPVIISFNANP